MSVSMAQRASGRVGLKTLIGSGDKIGGFMLPFLIAGVLLNVWKPTLFAVGGPADALRLASWAVLAVGFIGWAWSVFLILAKVPRGELITSGPFALVKHPLYTDIALLVLPSVGFLLNSWLGALLGAVLYVATRRYAPAEEQKLAREFGQAWDTYDAKVLLPWL